MGFTAGLVVVKLTECRCCVIPQKQQTVLWESEPPRDLGQTHEARSRSGTTALDKQRAQPSHHTCADTNGSASSCSRAQTRRQNKELVLFRGNMQEGDITLHSANVVHVRPRQTSWYLLAGFPGELQTQVRVRDRVQERVEQGILENRRKPLEAS